MTKIRETRSKKKKNRKNLEVLKLLNNKVQKKGMNEEVIVKKMLKFSIVF